MNEISKKLPSFTDLGRDLMADAKGHLYNQLLQEIDGRISQKESAIAAGLTTEDKARFDAELKALTAAHRIVSLFWNSIHHKTNDQP